MGAAAGFAAENSPADPVEAALNAIIDQSWAQQTPGIQVGLWVPGRGEWKIAKGLSNIARNKPMRIGMQQPIGSITKTMTGTLILQLVEEGKMSLNDRLSKWFPGAPEADTNATTPIPILSSSVKSRRWLPANPMPGC
jgi:D-alanyl-D-alanine carboxypeptidase